MAIGSNPLSSTRKSARAAVGSVFQETLEVLMGQRGLNRSAVIMFRLFRRSRVKFRIESLCDEIWVPKPYGQSGIGEHIDTAGPVLAGSASRQKRVSQLSHKDA